MTKKIINLIIAYVKSMRPYSFFVTGTAGILGLLLVESQGELWRNILILTLLFTSYGINQVINDLLGNKEDKYNAPSRPLVSGEISRKAAFFITVILFIVGMVATYFLNPYALIIYLLAYLMNIIYEWMKGIPFLGNLWFGFLIGLAPLYGILASTDLNLLKALYYPNLVYFILLVAASSSALCYYTYFKDYEGDKKAGKRTLVVVFGPQGVKYFNFPISILPFLLLWTFIQLGFLTYGINPVFIILTIIAFIFCLYAAFSTFKNLKQNKKTLELNFECTPLFLSALIAIISPVIGSILFVSSFIIVKIFYKMMYRKKFY
jgi:geranylgeranylglycerol-phosphate geranylgeranyltransferase